MWSLNQKSFFDLTRILSGKRLGELDLHCCIFFLLSKSGAPSRQTADFYHQVCIHEPPFSAGVRLVELRGTPLVENALMSKHS